MASTTSRKESISVLVKSLMGVIPIDAQQVLIVLQPDIAAAEQPLALRVTCEAEIEGERQRHPENAKHHHERRKDRHAGEIAIEHDGRWSPCRARRRCRYQGGTREL